MIDQESQPFKVLMNTSDLQAKFQPGKQPAIKNESG